MARYEPLYLMADFETTVYEGQEETAVWGSSVCTVGKEDGEVFTSIDELWEFLVRKRRNVVIFFHNLKFDGSFWLYYFLNHNYELAADRSGDTVSFLENKEMKKHSFKYSISSKGVFYTITVRTSLGFIVEFRDSLKLLPSSVEKLGKAFNTKHRKTAIEYEGYRKPFGTIAPNEKSYMLNDVYVPSECLSIMFSQGHDRLTIGSCALAEFKQMLGSYDFSNMFPDLSSKECPLGISYHEYIWNYYRGAWCYCKSEGKATNGVTLDVTSLYPSTMHSKLGYKQPCGAPAKWLDEMPSEFEDRYYYFIHIRCRFDIKEGYLPSIQIKRDLRYSGNEWLSSSRIRDREGNLHDEVTVYGDVYTSTVELYLTEYDYRIFIEHYEVYDMEFIDGCAFWTHDYEFDMYINKYIKQKNESTGALREIAKLFLNNLYGKLASSDDSSFKLAYLKDDGSIGYDVVEAHDKKTVYIPGGAAITSMARHFTITHAQLNYDSFRYADTDSLHLECPIEAVVGCRIAKNELGTWKHESSWDVAYFTRQKTYIEHVTEEGGIPCEPHYSITACGMGKRPKELVAYALCVGEDGMNPDEAVKAIGKHYPDEEEFVRKGMKLTEFTKGLTVPSNLKGRNIKGGVLLVRQDFEMR